VPRILWGEGDGMRMGWLVTAVLVIAATMPPVAVGQAQAQEAQGKQTEECSLPKVWDPAEDLPRILAEHRRWTERWEANDWSEEWARNFPQGQANLCKASLEGANLTEARLDGANLTGAELFGTNLTGAELFGTNLTGARLGGANLTKAWLRRANLTGAWLDGANLTGAWLDGANLTEAELFVANLTGAELFRADLTEARLFGVNLTNAIYTPALPPSGAYVANIQGLQAVVFPKGLETGLVQLREVLQKAGLRDLEREATFAIERGKTWHSLNLVRHWVNDNRENDDASDLSEALSKALEGIDGFDLVGLGKAVLDHLWVVESILRHRGEVGEGVFRLVAFDWTTGYGLYPIQALWIILRVWAVLILVYIWPIQRRPRSPNPASGIYRIWPSDRIETGRNEVKLGTAAKVERLQGKNWWGSFGYAAYFSLLSAFHIGWRDLSIGTWITRAQPREYTLKPTGWVRLVSGLQSLLSVYLLAIWGCIQQRCGNIL
jgi:hypothetical protein